MRILILSPQQVIYEGNVKEAILPGEDGELSVWDFHQPFLYRLRSGFIYIKGIWGREEKTAISEGVLVGSRMQIKNGIARMLRNELVITIER